MDVIELIAKNGRAVAGRKEYRKFAQGQRLTRGEAIKAKCYECNAGYPDGRLDCAIKSCPLYRFNPLAKKIQQKQFL
jgi:hypothetical protein